MPPQTTKKQLLLDFFRERGKHSLEMSDLRAARTQLRRQLGPGDRTSFGYMATLLRAAGYEVRYEDPYSDSNMPEPYASRLKGVLGFRDRPSAESSLQKLGEIYNEYAGAGDDVGTRWVRTLARRGWRRSQSLAANPRLQPAKRAEKQEIANWFRVWLETPDLLASWLALRKASEEFRKLFGDDAAG